MTAVTEEDLWRVEHDVLRDLMAFVEDHGPGSAHPLPVLFWRVGPARIVTAQVHAFEADPDGHRSGPREVVADYAAAFGSAVEEHRDGNRTLLVARGRISPPARDDTGTQIMVSAEVPASDRQPPGGIGAVF